MNEQIHKLYKQAVVDYGFDYYLPTPTWERFAELIVRECADIAGQEDFDVMMKEGYPCSQTAKKIKEHFGIEE